MANDISSASKSIPKVPRQILRAVRFEELPDSFGLNLNYEDRRIPIQNISETGIGIVFDGELFESATVVPLDIQTLNGASLFSGFGRVVRKEAYLGKIYYGVEFQNRTLSKDLLKLLDQLLAIEHIVVRGQNEFIEIPIPLRELVYEIKSFFQKLKLEIDALEEKLEIESPETKNSLIQALDVRFGKFVINHLNDYGSRLHRLMDAMPDLARRKTCINFFRDELNEFYLKGPYSKRAMLKPLGYAGDYEMMNQVYRNQYEGSSLFAKLIHKYAINEPAAASVRDRRKTLAQKILEEHARKGRGPLKVCSLASGPAQEIVEILTTYKGGGLNIELFLVDQDVESLLDARRNITNHSSNPNVQLKIHCLPIAIKHIIEKAPQANDVLANKFDLIYSAGLFDYLTQPTAKFLTDTLIEALNPGGRLLIGNFHPNSPTRAICEFAVEWRLVYRTANEMRDMASNRAGISTFSDSNEIVVFLDYRK